ncbi:MAG: sulfotransferase domain-containing protein [Myxococcota bacterium]
MLDRIPWNLTRKLDRYREVDVIVLSLGKSGRTWLRVMLHRYLSLHYQLPFDPIRLDPRGTSAPLIAYSHELATHLREHDLVRQLVGKAILPRSLTDQKQIVILARDPRDVVISSYFHKTERSRKTDCSVEEYLHHPRWGIESLVTILNHWRRRFAAHPRCHWLRYEGLRKDPGNEMERLVSVIDGPVDREALAVAIEEGRFERMQAAEASGAYTDVRLRPGDRAKPDSFKVRRGRVGGYRDYLGSHEIAFVDEAIRKLDPFYGYG